MPSEADSQKETMADGAARESATALTSMAESGEGEGSQLDGQARGAEVNADSEAQLEEDLDKVIQELSMEVR